MRVVKFSVSEILVLISGFCFGIFFSQHLKGEMNLHNANFEKPKQSNLSAFLDGNVKLFCWILTNPKNEHRWKHIAKLLARKCSKTIFVSSQPNYHKHGNVEVVAVSVGKDSRSSLWAKTKEAFVYSYKHYYDQYDWFMKMDDDTYVMWFLIFKKLKDLFSPSRFIIFENLKRLLYKFNSSLPLLLGHRNSMDLAQKVISHWL